MKRLLLLLPLILLAAAAVWYAVSQNRPPEVEFAKVTRETIVDNLTTNGKIEPVDWAAAHAEAGGSVARVFVRKGGTVKAGAPLVELEAREARAALESADSRIAQARAELETLDKGGRAAEQASLDGSLNEVRQQLAASRKEMADVERLVEKKAATAHELIQLRDRVAQLEAQAASIEKRRASLVTAADKSGAQARLRDAQAAAKLAASQLSTSIVRAPVEGVVYQMTLKPGEFLRPGDEVARIGQTNQVRAIIYIDEPELGRAGIGKPVTITWDAKPQREWRGEVEKMPLQIVALGQRQVGEVQCRIDNPDRDLIPGANINATIRASVASGVVAIPKAALRRDNGEAGVFVLNTADNTVTWKAIRLGVSSLVKTQAADGLAEGDLVALPTESPLANGFKVTPKIQNAAPGK